jgi:hypothetical protein
VTDRARRVRVGFVRTADATLRRLDRDERTAMFDALKRAALLPDYAIPMSGEAADCIRVVAGRWECVVARSGDRRVVLAIAPRSNGEAARGLRALDSDPDLATLLRAHMRAVDAAAAR